MARLRRIDEPGSLPPEFVDLFNTAMNRLEIVEQLLESLIGEAPGSLGGCILRTPSGGIPAAADDDTPAFADGCMLRVFDGETFADSMVLVRAYNFATGVAGAVAGNKQIACSPLYGKPGFQFVVVDPC